MTSLPVLRVGKLSSIESNDIKIKPEAVFEEAKQVRASLFKSEERVKIELPEDLPSSSVDSAKSSAYSHKSMRET